MLSYIGRRISNMLELYYIAVDLIGGVKNSCTSLLRFSTFNSGHFQSLKVLMAFEAEFFFGTWFAFAFLVLI